MTLAVQDERTRLAMRKKAEEYMERAEKLKSMIEKAKATGDFHEQQIIEDGSIGHSYESVFGHFLDNLVEKVEVDDAYVRSIHQVSPIPKSSTVDF